MSKLVQNTVWKRKRKTEQPGKMENAHLLENIKQLVNGVMVMIS